jgi:hypothetical protein
MISNSNIETETTIVTASEDDMRHHSWAKKYADSYIEERLKHLSSGESSHQIRNNLMGNSNFHNDERMIKNVIRHIALSPLVEKSYEGNLY